MGDILVIIEHRNGEIREVSLEMLLRAHELFSASDLKVVAVLLQGPQQSLESSLMGLAHKIIVAKGKGLEVYEPETYLGVLQGLITNHRPFLVMMAHTPWGMDLAPALSVRTGLPLVTDCVDLSMEGEELKAIRQIYGGKLYSKVRFRKASTYLASIRPGTRAVEGAPLLNTEVINLDALPPPGSRREFVEFRETGQGEVDIGQAPFLVSIGRGVGEQERIQEIEELTKRLGAVLSCSRPVVDKNWLPKYRQVGTSGKSVKPKVYLALGISGAFQHVAAIKGSGTIIAVNKDKKAPIFRVAHYGVAEDLFKVVAALKEKIGG